MQLFITDPGSAFSIENGRFCIRKKDEKHLYSVYEVQSVFVHKGVSITHDAITTAVENDVDLIFVNKFQKPFARIWSEKPASISTIRKNQLHFSNSSLPKMEWTRNLLLEKIQQQSQLIDLLQCVYNSDPKLSENTLINIKNLSEKITIPKDFQEEILANTWRGIEGNVAKQYFNFISKILPENYRFEKRTRPASDMFNALLNYTYGILYSKVESALLKAGLDPYIGLWHRDDYNRPSLVFDVIERYRAWADYTVIHLCMQEVILPNSFSIAENGMLMIDEDARRITTRAFFDYMEDIVEINGYERSRLTHILHYCQQLATFFKTLQ